MDLNGPRITGHTAAVLDIKFCPFNEYVIASASEDSTVKVWELPEGGLKESMSQPVVNLQGHQRRVGIIEWHPTAENILFSAGFDYMVRKRNVWLTSRMNYFIQYLMPDSEKFVLCIHIYTLTMCTFNVLNFLMLREVD